MPLTRDIKTKLKSVRDRPRTGLKQYQFSKVNLIIVALIFGGIGSYFLFRSFAATSSVGDANNDGQINISDISILLTNFGTTNSQSDFNNDGTSNIVDLSILLSHYGQTTAIQPACTLYVSPTGNGDGLSVNTPTNIDGAYIKQVPGSVVCLTAGTYPISSTRWFDKGGTAANWVVWRPLGNGEVVISGNNFSTPSTVFGFDDQANYIEISGLTFDGNGAYNSVIAVHALQGTHHHRFINNRFTRFSSSAIESSCSDYLTAVGNQIWRYGDGVGWSSGISYNPQPNCGGALWADNLPGFHIIIADNIITGGYDGSVYKTDGNGIILDSGDNIPPALISNNLIYMTGGRCIVTLMLSGKVYVVNNTCYKNSLDLSEHGFGEIAGNNVTNEVWSNNIANAWTGRYTYQLYNTTSVSFNRTDQFGGLGPEGVDAQTAQDPSQIRTADPMFVSPPVVNPTADLQWQNPPTPWTLGNAFQLQVGSPLVDSATDPRTLPGLDATMISQIDQYVMKDLNGRTRVSGSIDYGAYER